MNNPDYVERECTICGWEYVVHYSTAHPFVCLECWLDEPPDWVKDEER